MDNRLQGREYLVGNHLTIADIAHFPWIKGHGYAELTIDEFPNLKAWLQRIESRPAVQKCYSESK